MAKRANKVAAGKPAYKPTPHEATVIRKHLDASSKRVPRVTISKADGRVRTSNDHPVEAIGRVLLMDALGTQDEDFCQGLIGQLLSVGSQGQDVDERDVNFVLSMVKGVAPRDEVEAMLAAQMAAVHLATMTLARRLAHVENIPQQDSAERAFNKLARTFATQMETLKRYRTGGEQKVTVQHVNVREGGQAIVGNVTQASR